MEQQYSGGSWSMVPSITHSNASTPSSQDHLYFQHQQQHYQQQQQRQIHQQQQQQQHQHHQSLASNFHLLHMVENLAEVIENGTWDQHSDALVSELNSQFEKCQQLLNSIGSINTKAMTVEAQKRKLEESEQLLNQRRDLMTKYKNSIEEIIKSEP